MKKLVTISLDKGVHNKIRKLYKKDRKVLSAEINAFLMNEIEKCKLNERFI